MMRLLLTFVLLIAGTANAWTYYVTKDGSDSDDGKSWANSWLTIGKVNATLAAGDTVYFGTGTWYGASIMPPTGGDASNVTVYSCSTMTIATRGLTIISGGEVVSTWTLHSGSVYKKAWTSAAGYYDAGAGTTDRVYTLSQNDTLLEPQTSIANINASGEFFHDHTNDTLYIRCFGDVDPSSRTMVASNRPTVWFTATPDFSSNNRRNQDYLHFYGLDLRMGKAAVIYYWDIADGANDHNVYEQCNITRAGFIDGENPACIMVRSGFANPSYDSANINDYVRYVTVKNCSLGVCSYWEGAAEAHRGSGAIIYDGTNFVFDSTTFFQLASDGVEVKNSGSGDGEIAAQHTFRFCKFDRMGYNGVNIYTNAHRDSVYGCIFDSIYEAGIKIGQSSAGNDDRGDHFICNNTFNECNIAFEVRPNEDVPRDYAPFTAQFKYNVIYNKVASGFTVLAEQYFPQSLAGATVPLDIWIDSNQYYDPSNSFVARWGDGTDRNWSYWQGTADNDSNGLNTDQGLNTTTFATTSAGTMSRTYGGQDWTVWGAIQPEESACADTLVAPVFATPANGATGQVNSAILDWSDSTQAGTVDLYDLQVDNNSDFSSVTFSSSTAWSKDTVTAALALSATYYWRVRSRSDCDTSAWSGYRYFTMDDTTFANPVNSWLDPNSTLDDHTLYLPGMDAAAPPDADTLAMLAGWKMIIWSAGGSGSSRYGAFEAAHLKTYDSTRKLLIYSSMDHGLRSISTAIDTSDPGNEWNATADEYSHLRKIAEIDSGKSYYTCFYHFAVDTKILLFPSVRSSYFRYDTVFFEAATLPISDDDSNSVVPNTYSSPYFANYGTLVEITADTIEGGATDTIYARFNYQGTPIGSKTTRVFLDFSNPLARYADLKYQLRAMSQNFGDLGGNGNDVYGWKPLSDSGYHLDGTYWDNAGNNQHRPPEGAIIISGGDIYCSRGIIGRWDADSTQYRFDSHFKEYFRYVTNYYNNPANFWDNLPRATAANFGDGDDWYNSNSRNNIRQWWNDSNAINVKVIENSAMDGGYLTDNAYETNNSKTRSVHDLEILDSLADANDFYVMFSGRVNVNDTTVASGWSDMLNPFLRSNWVRIKTTIGHRGLFAVQPAFALTVGTINWQPCNSGGYSYQGLNYSPYCNDRAEADSFVTRCTLPFFSGYDLGAMNTDTDMVTMNLTDSAGVAVSVYRTYWVDANSTDTTYSYMYYFPRKTSSTEQRKSGLHAVRITPPSANYRLLEYSGASTPISGASQLCWVGDQLILTYNTASLVAGEESVMNIIRGICLQGVTIK